MEYERFFWSVVWILFLGCIFSSWHFPHFPRFWLVCLWILISQWALWMGLESLFWISRPKMPQEMLGNRPMLLHSSLVTRTQPTNFGEPWFDRVLKHGFLRCDKPPHLGSNALHCLMCCQFCSKFCAWPDGKVNLTWILATSWIPYGLHAHAGSVMAFDFLFVTASGLKRLTILEIFDALTCLQQAAAMAAVQWWPIGDGDWWKNSSPRWGWTFHSYRVSHRCVGQKPGCCRSQTWAGGILFDGGILPSRTYSSWHAV